MYTKNLLKTGEAHARTGDLYETPPGALDAVLERLPPAAPLWEPFPGEARRSTQHMRARGRDVVNKAEGASDDFWEQPPLPERVMLTNPPFSQKVRLFRWLQEHPAQRAVLLIPVEALQTAYLDALLTARGVRPALLYFTRRLKFLEPDTGEPLRRPFPYGVGWLEIPPAGGEPLLPALSPATA